MNKLHRSSFFAQNTRKPKTRGYVKCGYVKVFDSGRKRRHGLEPYPNWHRRSTVTFIYPPWCDETPLRWKGPPTLVGMLLWDPSGKREFPLNCMHLPHFKVRAKNLSNSTWPKRSNGRSLGSSTTPKVEPKIGGSKTISFCHSFCVGECAAMVATSASR